MFLFIVNVVLSRRTGDVDLNTSHVLIHRCLPQSAVPERFDLNTSHVLIHLSYNSSFFSQPTFKYISCSYSSDKPLSNDFVDTNLNTSHVLIHHPHK